MRRKTYEEALEELDRMYKKHQGRSVIHDEPGIKAWVPWLRGLIPGSTPEGGTVFVENVILNSAEYDAVSRKRLAGIFKLHLNREPNSFEKDTLLNIIKFYDPFETAKTIVESIIMNQGEYISSHPIEVPDTEFEATIAPDVLEKGGVFRTTIEGFTGRAINGFFSQALKNKEDPRIIIWLPDNYDPEKNPEGTYEFFKDTGLVQEDFGAVMPRSWESPVPDELFLEEGEYELLVGAYIDPYGVPNANRKQVGHKVLNTRINSG